MLYQIKFGVPSDINNLLSSRLESETPENAFASISSDLEKASRIFEVLSVFVKFEGVTLKRGFEDGHYIDCDIPIPLELKPWLETIEPSKVFLEEHLSLLKGKDEESIQIQKNIPFVAPITTNILADSFAILEGENLCVKAVLMSANRYADLRKFGRDVLDIQYKTWILKQGLMAKIWGASVIIDRKYENKVVVLGLGEQGWRKLVLETD